MAAETVAIAQVTPFGARFVLSAVNTVEAMIGSVVRWHHARRTRIILMSLSDDILKDIGVEGGWK